MTIQEYIDNPMGKGDAAMGANRAVFVNVLTQKYKVLTNKKRIKMYAYKARNKYFIHLIIPSETERNNTYDVVFEFSDKDKEHDKELSIRNFNVRVFANSPSFAYTFAYVYKKHNLLIDGLVKKLGKEFVKIAPDVRNRYQIVNYEKYVFFGAKYILDSGILNRAKLDKEAKSLVGGTFPLAKVRSLDEIMDEYNKEVAKLKKERNKEKVQKEKDARKAKKELQNVKSGIHKVGTIQKSAANSSSIKHLKPIGSGKRK